MNTNILLSIVILSKIIKTIKMIKMLLMLTILMSHIHLYLIIILHNITINSKFLKQVILILSTKNVILLALGTRDSINTD